MEQVRLVEERVGTQWVITSPDVRGLYVADSDLQIARRGVPAAVEMLKQMAKRREAREQVEERLAAHA